MPDKRLTDSEIKEALECCDNCFCENCVYHPKINCREELSHDALDLINRLQAENEILKTGFEKTLAEVREAKELYVKDIAKAKAEAYKECIEKVKEFLKENGFMFCSDADNILKKLVGENNGD